MSWIGESPALRQVRFYQSNTELLIPKAGDSLRWEILKNIYRGSREFLQRKNSCTYFHVHDRLDNKDVHVQEIFGGSSQLLPSGELR